MEGDREGSHFSGKKRKEWWYMGTRDVVCFLGRCHHFFVVVGTSTSKPGSSFPVADTMGSSLGMVVPTFFITAEKILADKDGGLVI